MTRTAVKLTTDVIGICEEMTRDSKRGVGVRALGEKYAPRMVAVDREAATLDAEVAALRENVAHFQTSTAKYMEEAMALRARVAELEAEAAAVAPWISPEAQHCMDAGKVHPLAPVLNAYVASVAEDARAAMLSPMRGAGLGFHSSRSQATRMLIMVMWDALQASRDELLKPRSPNALELAMEYGIAHAVCVMHTDSSPFFIEGFARRSRAIAALVAYDDWRPK